MSALLKRSLRTTPAEVIVASFLLLSVIGAVLLSITEAEQWLQTAEPEHHIIELRSQSSLEEWTEQHTRPRFHERKGLSPVDAWFTATSALCVTGLTVTDFSRFTTEGKILVLLLIQIGGLGIFVFSSLLVIAVFRGLQENQAFTKILAANVDSESHDALAVVRYILLFTITIEGGATLIMGGYLSWFADNPPIGAYDPWWWALFHSISAFNNAGFSLMPSSLVAFAYDPVINLTITASIILGGLGYPVLLAFFIYVRSGVVVSRDTRNARQLEFVRSGVASPVQIRIAVTGTVVLLLLGTALIFLKEMGNPANDAVPPLKQLWPAWFMSVSARTAGFNTVSVGDMHAPTFFTLMILMFIGANPAGTGGGIKVPTVAVLIGYIVDWFRKPGEPVILFGRRVSRFAKSHAVRLFFFAVAFLAMGVTTILYIERQWLQTTDSTFNPTKIVFETISAFSTTGLSIGFEGSNASFSAILSDSSKVVLTFMMLFGRVGPLVVLAALPWKRRYRNHAKSPDVPESQKVQIG